MSDTLQLVVVFINTQPDRNSSTKPIRFKLVVVLINTQLNRNDSPNLKQMIRSLELDAFQLR